MIRSIYVAILLLYGIVVMGQSDITIPIDSIAISANTAAKPQAKIWTYNEDFYSVFSISTGTYIWKLGDRKWEAHLLLSSKNNSKADCFATGRTVYILLFQGEDSEFTTVTYNTEIDQYLCLNTRTCVSPVEFDESVETATIALDDAEVIWMTYESHNNIVVRNSTAPYHSWSSPEIIAKDVAADDISAIIKMKNSVGVFWSNQNSRLFGFKIHNDGDPISSWSKDEQPGLQSALNVGDGMADDYINIKYTSDDALYVAVKTSYDMTGRTKIGLLLRRPNGRWDKLYHVSDAGTRPIVTIDSRCNTAKLFYSSKEKGGDIIFRETPLDRIDFGPSSIFIEGEWINNVSSGKFPYSRTNVVIASSATHLLGKMVIGQCP